MIPDPIARLRAIVARRAELQAELDTLATERDTLLRTHRTIYRTQVLLDAAGVSRSHLYRVAGQGAGQG